MIGMDAGLGIARRRRLLRFATVAFLAVAGPTSAAWTQDPEPSTAAVATDLVATVGDVELTADDLERVMRRRSFGRTIAADQEKRFRAESLGELIEETLLRAEIERRNIVVEEPEVNDRMALISKELAARKMSLDGFLAQTGLDHSGFRRQITFDLGVPKLVVPLVTNDVRRKVQEEYHREFDGTRLRASHIVLRPDGSAGAGATETLLAKAERIRREIAGGATSFAEAAALHSAGPSRRRGGDIGFFPRHGMLSEDFTRRAFALQEGEISKPFETQYGVHIVTVTDVDEGTAPPERYRNEIERIAFQTMLANVLKQCRQRQPVSLAPGLEVADPRSEYLHADGDAAE